MNIPLAMTSFKLGLGWDTECDIDSSVLMVDEKGELLENIYFGNKVSKHEAVKHGGDNLTGEGKGDDEVIDINLSIVDQ